MSVDLDRMSDDDDDTLTSRPGNGYRLFDGFTSEHMRDVVCTLCVGFFHFVGSSCIGWCVLGCLCSSGNLIVC